MSEFQNEIARAIASAKELKLFIAKLAAHSDAQTGIWVEDELLDAHGAVEEALDHLREALKDSEAWETAE